MVQVESRGILEGVELREGCTHEERSAGAVNNSGQEMMVGIGLMEGEKPVLNARRGIANIIAEIALGKGPEKQYKRGSAAYLIHKIQVVLRLITLVFSFLILVFIVTYRVNRGRKTVFGSFPVGSLGRSLKFDLMLDTLEREDPALKQGYSEDSLGKAEGESFEDVSSEVLDDPEYWADDNDRDLWEDDLDEYYDMEIVSSEGDSGEADKMEEGSEEAKTNSGERSSQLITGKRNKGLRSKGVEVSLPSSLTLYGRVSQDDTYVNGIYNIIMENREDGKSRPRLHHGRAIYRKEKTVLNESSPELFIVFDGAHEFWTINSSLDPGSKPLAFLPDHGLIPIRHVGPYGAHSNSTWVFRSKDGISKDSSVRIVENSSIEFPRVPVYITKATHNWHIKHHNHTNVKVSPGKAVGKSEVRVYRDPYN